MTSSNYISVSVAEAWRCTACGAELDDESLRIDASWRWCPPRWEHRCPDTHPQCGHFQAEQIGEVALHTIWEVDAGNVYWCIAADENDALALVIEAEELSNGYCPVSEDWHGEGWPVPERVTFDSASKIHIYDEVTDSRLTLLMEIGLDPRRRTVGCSEY